MIKSLSQNPLNYLLSLFNQIFTDHVFPAIWQDAIVIPFPKPGKDPTDPKNTAQSPSQAVCAKSSKKW